MSISTPVQITVPFATSGLKNPIPGAANPITGNAGYDLGFPAINMTPQTAGGIPPFGQDFNGVFFDLTTAVQYLEAGGSFPYSSAFSTAVGGYPLGAIVSRTDGSGLWRNTVANNTTNPETFGAGWQPEDAGSTAITMTNANVTLTALQAARSIIIITGTLTANLQLILPAYVKQWMIANNCTGAFTITAKTAAGSGIVISTLSSVQVYGDGTNINGASASSSILPAGYFSGFSMLNNVSSPNTTADIGPGSAKDSTGVIDINLSATLSGVLQAAGAWTAGNNQNKLDTGARANSSTYFVFAIRKTSDGTGDILYSLSATAPTMPTGYSGFRRISRLVTGVTGNIGAFKDRGNARFDWVTPNVEVTAGPVPPATSLLTLTGLGGAAVNARVQVLIRGDGASGRITPTDVTDAVTGVLETDWTGGAVAQSGGSSSDESGSAEFHLQTDTSSQVRLRTFGTGGVNVRYRVITFGWQEIR